MYSSLEPLSCWFHLQHQLFPLSIERLVKPFGGIRVGMSGSAHNESLFHANLDPIMHLDSFFSPTLSLSISKKTFRQSARNYSDSLSRLPPRRSRVERCRAAKVRAHPLPSTQSHAGACPGCRASRSPSYYCRPCRQTGKATDGSARPGNGEVKL